MTTDASEHRTGRKLPDGSWEPGPYSDWTDANPAEDDDNDDPMAEERRLYEAQHGHDDTSNPSPERTYAVTLTETERNVVLDALALTVESPGWDRDDQRLAQELHDRITNAR